MIKEESLYGKSYYEQTYYDPVHCPKCVSSKNVYSYFDMENRESEWRNEEDTDYYLTMPSGETRRDTDYIILQCPVCQSKIKVVFITCPMLGVSLVDDRETKEEKIVSRKE